MDGWIGRLDRSTINNAFSFSHYYTTHFAGHSTDVNPLFSLFALEVILSAAFVACEAQPEMRLRFAGYSIWDAS